MKKSPKVPQDFLKPPLIADNKIIGVKLSAKWCVGTRAAFKAVRVLSLTSQETLKDLQTSKKCGLNLRPTRKKPLHDDDSCTDNVV